MSQGFFTYDGVTDAATRTIRRRKARAAGYPDCVPAPLESCDRCGKLDDIHAYRKDNGYYLMRCPDHPPTYEDIIAPGADSWPPISYCPYCKHLGIGHFGCAAERAARGEGA